jgi:hypothetical protein
VDGSVRGLAMVDEDWSGGGQPALVVGGSFANAGGQPSPGLARWNGAAWSGIAGGLAGEARALALFDDTGYGVPPVLFVGGDFTSAGGVATHSLARWGCPWPSNCYANCDASTIPPVLNVQDFGCFLGAFASGDTYANCDHSTSPPILNVLDFICFLNEFARGCL